MTSTHYSTHYSTLGASTAPQCADGEGFVHFRDGFERLPESEWTSGERWIADQQSAIDRFRDPRRCPPGIDPYEWDRVNS